MTPSPLPDFLHALQRRIDGDLHSDAVTRLLYSTDASIYQVEPHGVLLPRHADDMQAAMTLAAEYGVPLLARAGGSSLAGQAVNEALIIDTSRHLDQLLELNVAERWARVQPGIVLDQLNARLRPHGLQFGPDPASSNRATLGGIVSNNATGAHSIVYGMAVDHVRAMRVILSDGSTALLQPQSTRDLLQTQAQTTLDAAVHRQIAALVHHPDNQAVIRRDTPRHWRRCGGYNLDRFVDGVSFHHPHDPRFNLARLICGAEGTLALITELTVDLVPLPPHKALALVQFDSLVEALNAVPVILETDPSAVELLDHLSLSLCRGVPAYARLLATFVDGTPEAILVCEFAGDAAHAVTARLAHLRDHLRRRGVPFSAIVDAPDAARQAAVWRVRKAGLGLLMSMKGDHKPIPFIEDAAVPVEHLADYVTQIEQFCRDLGTQAAYYAHASAGCLHVRPLINTKDAADIAKMPEILSFAVELLGQYGGVLSSEHGDGRSRSWLNERFFGPELYRLFRQVKHIFDPRNLLNPGNIVDAGPMTANLRFGAGYTSLSLTTYLDFSADLGFDRAVEMCNGAAVCRKPDGGTMCPSFMVTRAEQDSTRGRANALRGVLAGRLPPEALTSTQLYEVMDLCISCKACKAECPSSVDMARLKTEFLAHYQAAHGVPLRSRLLGNVAWFGRISSGPHAPVVNRLLRTRLVKHALARLLDVAPTRTLPPFAPQPFTAWFRRRRPPTTGRPPVALFNDTFSTYNEPHIAIAATELLEAAGFAVVLPGHHCCGRPALSKGLVVQARAQAARTLDRLAPLAARGTPIVGLEPSCLSALRDDYAALLPGDARVPLVAAHTLALDEFVMQLDAAGRWQVPLRQHGGTALLHGHCHDKALESTKPSHHVLGLLGFAVTEIDSGCCGMAGSFGYEAEHSDISFKMAERRLLPAIRAADESTVIVAAGTSCRHQIADGSGRRAWHSAELLRAALPTPGTT